MKRTIIFGLFAVILGYLSPVPVTAQNTTCATRPVGDNSNACASTAFVQNSNAVAAPAVTIESKGGGCAVADNTAALLSAVASVSGAVRVLFTQNCTYNFVQANAITFTKGGVFLECANQFSGILQYTPTSDGTFLKWSNGVNEMFWGGISKCALISPDITHSKVMAEWYDVSSFDIDQVYCIGPASTRLRGGTDKSACLYSHGRDDTRIHRFQANAEIPIHIGMNPHSYLSTDHYHFSDLYLIGNTSGTDPLIKVDPGVVFTDTTFDGEQAWVAGFNGFNYQDTSATSFLFAVTAAGSGYTAGTPITMAGGTCSTPITVTPLTVNGSGGILTAAVLNPGVCSVIPSNPVSATAGGAVFTLGYVASYRLSFSNVRAEQGFSSSAYTFNIQPNGGLQGLVIDNSAMDSVTCGTKLKNVTNATISNSTYLLAGSCNEAVNATSANGNDSLQYINNFWLLGVTQNVTGLTNVDKTTGPANASATVPPNALYTVATTGRTLNNPIFSGTASGAGTIPNSVLVNSATTVNGQTCTLGAACTITAAASSIAVGTTTISGGTTLRVLYDNAGVLGEMTTSGSGTQLVLSTTPSISAPTITTSFTATGLVTNASLATMLTNTIKGNATSGTASPTDLSITSCSTTASALLWTTNTGFSCNTAIVAASATSATNTTNVAITDDTTTNATMFPAWVTANTGNLPAKVSSTKFSFNPSTGALFSTKAAFGTNLAPDSTLVVNNNSALSVAPGIATDLHVVAPNASVGGIFSDVYSGETLFVGRAAAGTLASKSALTAGAYLGLLGQTWDGSAYTSNAVLEFSTINTQSLTDHSSRARLAVTPSGSTTLTDVMLWGPGVAIGSGAADPGAGNLNLGGGSLLNNGTSPTGTGAYVRGTSPTLSTVDARGVWTTGTSWTLPAITLGGTVSGGGNQLNNIIIGTTTPLAGTFTTLTANTSISSPIHTTSGSLTFQSNGSTFAGSISTGQLWFLGSTSLTAAAGSQLTVSQNTGGTPLGSGIANILNQSIAADTVIGLTTLDTFGNQGFMSSRYAAGTQASKTAATGGTTTFSFGGQAWDASGATSAAYGTGAAIDFITSASTWSSSNHGMSVRFRTVVDGATTLTERMRIIQGLTTDTTDPGVGGLRFTGATIQFTALASDVASTDNTVCVSSAGTLLKGSGALGVCLGTSGRQFKMQFAPMQAGMAEIAALRLWNYRYRDGFGDSGARLQYGPTAQDVEAVLPGLVRHDANGVAINYDSGAFMPIALHALQQLDHRLSALEHK